MTPADPTPPVGPDAPRSTGGPQGSGAESPGAASPSSPARDRAELLASPAHTARFVALLLVMAVLIAQRTAHVSPEPGRSHVIQYLVLLGLEWMLFWFAWAGLRARGTSLRDVLGGRWASFRDVATTLVVAATFWVAARVVLGLVRSLLAMSGLSSVAEAQRTQALMAPHGAVEIGLWVLLSASAGFCEEFVFRGYLQRQLAALTRHAWLGILASAVVFGAGHLYQGWRSVILITVYGLLFGVLAHLVRSLRPGMIVHAWQDMFSGLYSG